MAPTELSVLITGESGVGKENFSKIIHDYSACKHGPFIAINCGAIPEGTIDSELFGHEKGAFTGALDTRKGYFEVADGGTIFLDEVADLPLATQVRLLRVLENGEFIKVGSNKVQKTKIRVVAATNINMLDKIAKGKFREDLYYRLNAVPIHIPPLRERKDDIFLIFLKFSTDFSLKYKIPPISLTDEAKEMLKNFYWPGNVRQLRNITEQISIIEKDREITPEILQKYLVALTPQSGQLVVVDKDTFAPFEKELIFKYLQDLTLEVTELRKKVSHLMQASSDETANLLEINAMEHNTGEVIETESVETLPILSHKPTSLINSEKEIITQTLKKFDNKRKLAAEALGLPERTLSRKIKEYNIQSQ